MLLVAVLAVLAVQQGVSARAHHFLGPPSGRLQPLQRLADSLTRPFAPVEGMVSAQCRQHSQLYLRSLGQLADWAMHMYDASTKIPSSVLAGNIQQLGNYDQCVSVRVTDGDTGSDMFRGKHCTATVILRVPPAASWGESPLGDLLLAAANASGFAPGESSSPFDWSFCVPSSCSGADVEAALTARFEPFRAAPGHAADPGEEARILISVDNKQCVAADGGRQNAPLTAGDIAFICLLVVTTYVLCASTLYDVLAASKVTAAGGRLSRLQELMVSFSLARNGRELVSTARSGDTMGCMHGIRVLSISWVILLHSAYMEATAPNINKAVVPKLGDYWGNMMVMNATLATDTFFLLSGTLLAISFLRSAGAASGSVSGNTPRFNPLAFYWHRYVRITPVYAVVIWFYASMLVRLGGGPLWDRVVGTEADFCAANWWTNLAYVNNLVNLAAPCMNQTWYLAVDMQLFWLSPLVLYPLVRWPRFGRVMLLVLIILSIAVPFAITFTERLTGAMLYTLDQSMLAEVFVLVYTRVYNRAGAYLVGICLGCVLHSVRGKGVYLPRPVLAVGWLGSGATCLAVLFGVFSFYQRDHRYSALESALYAGTHRTCWAAGVAWVVFSCVTGHGGPVNALLSWRPFAPLARLSYCVYLVHFVVLLVNHGLRRSPGHFSNYLLMHGALGTIVLSFGISAVLFLAYEMPFMALDRVLLPRGPARKTVEVTRNPEPLSIATVEAAKDSVKAELRGYDNAAFEKVPEK